MIHYNITGNGYPVVLIHGFCENNTCFNKQVLLLKEHCTVITPDLPGSGKTPAIPGITMEKMADEVHTMLEHLGIRQCLMIGHSMGGYVTLAFAAKYNSLLSGFGLLHSTVKADDEARKEKREQAKKVIAEKGADFYVSQFVPPLFKEGTPEAVIREFIDLTGPFTAEGLTSQLEAMKNRPDSTPVVEHSSLPVFFGIGKHDTIIPEDVMLKQVTLNKHSYVAYLEHSAHMGQLEEPALLADHILQFAANHLHS